MPTSWLVESAFWVFDHQDLEVDTKKEMGRTNCQCSVFSYSGSPTPRDDGGPLSP